MSGEAIAIIIAAAIGTVGTIIAGIISLVVSMRQVSSETRQMAEKNSADHGVVQQKLAGIKGDLDEIKNDVKSVDARIDQHVNWHLDHPYKEYQP